MNPPFNSEAGNGSAAAENVAQGQETAPANRPSNRHHPPKRNDQVPLYGALDLGTNNCRLLIARPHGRGFRVVDAFSRIIRLGEGVTQTGKLSHAAMDRTVDALKVCTAKMARRRVRRARLIATEACRTARNGDAFVTRVRRETGLELEIVSREIEAHLAVAGCAALLDPRADCALVFDIGGGSSELMWVSLARRGNRRRRGRRDQQGNATPPHRIAAWTSLPVGVVTLAERFGGVHVNESVFVRMVDHVRSLMKPFEQRCQALAPDGAGRAMHLLGTSGTVTTIAGIHLGLPRYDRSRVDGCWIGTTDSERVVDQLLAMSFEDRVRSPCIGRERADLVLAGCAILVAIQQAWPTDRLRVADRGLREGILSQLMAQDGFLGGRRPGPPPQRRAGR